MVLKIKEKTGPMHKHQFVETQTAAGVVIRETPGAKGSGSRKTGTNANGGRSKTNPVFIHQTNPL